MLHRKSQEVVSELKVKETSLTHKLQAKEDKERELNRVSSTNHGVIT